MTKKLNVAVQMDPLEDLTLAGDSTFVIALDYLMGRYVSS